MFKVRPEEAVSLHPRCPAVNGVGEFFLISFCLGLRRQNNNIDEDEVKRAGSGTTFCLACCLSGFSA